MHFLDVQKVGDIFAICIFDWDNITSRNLIVVELFLWLQSSKLNVVNLGFFVLASSLTPFCSHILKKMGEL